MQRKRGTMRSKNHKVGLWLLACVRLLCLRCLFGSVHFQGGLQKAKVFRLPYQGLYLPPWKLQDRPWEILWKAWFHVQRLHGGSFPYLLKKTTFRNFLGAKHGLYVCKRLTSPRLGVFSGVSSTFWEKRPHCFGAWGLEEPIFLLGWAAFPLAPKGWRSTAFLPAWVSFLICF